MCCVQSWAFLRDVLCVKLLASWWLEMNLNNRWEGYISLGNYPKMAELFSLVNCDTHGVSKLLWVWSQTWGLLIKGEPVFWGQTNFFATQRPLATARSCGCAAHVSIEKKWQIDWWVWSKQRMGEWWQPANLFYMIYMWEKHCHKPPMTGNGKHTTNSWWNWGWFIIVLPSLPYFTNQQDLASLNLVSWSWWGMQKHMFWLLVSTILWFVVRCQCGIAFLNKPVKCPLSWASYRKRSYHWDGTKKCWPSNIPKNLRRTPRISTATPNTSGKKPAGGWWFGWFGFGNPIAMVPTRNDSLHPGPYDESLENLSGNRNIRLWINTY